MWAGCSDFLPKSIVWNGKKNKQCTMEKHDKNYFTEEFKININNPKSG